MNNLRNEKDANSARYSFANWHSVSNSLDGSIGWQQKNYDLNVITKGRDHADTIAAKTKLARLKKRKSRK